ncbi:MAG: M20 family metallopeptidase [Chloroflexi bacterium]|nr:M20 family metallopeptidase [Chloroflexota bacterium]
MTLNTQQKQAVVAYLDQHRGDVVSLMQRMIQTRSVNVRLDPDSPGEAEMADLVRAEWESLGFDVEQDAAEKNRPNTISEMKGVGGGPRLLFNAHVDTVAVKDGDTWLDPETGETKSEWSVDPFGGVLKDGYVYGRGSCDHKSPTASLLWAVRALQASGVRLKGDLLVVNDVDEETGGLAGMRYLAGKRAFDVDAALFGTTTQFSKPSRPYFSAIGETNVVRAFSGMQQYRVDVSGKNYHSMTPLHGTTAIENLAKVMPAIQAYMARVNAYVDPVVGTGKPPMRLMNVKTAQRASNRPADVVELYINRRVDPSVDPRGAAAELKKLCEDLSDPANDLHVSAELLREVPANEVAADHPLVLSLADGIRETQGEVPTIAGIPAATGISQLISIQQIPVVTFAYGTLNFHHSIDERIPAEALVKTAQVYAAALMDYLGVAE